MEYPGRLLWPILLCGVWGCGGGIRSAPYVADPIPMEKDRISLLDPGDAGAWVIRPLHGSASRYEPLVEGGRRFVRATSEASAAFFARHVAFDPRRAPWVEWDWRVREAVDGEDLRIKSGNDCSARVVFGFQGDWTKATYFEGRAVEEEIRKTGYEPPGSLLVYVWSSTRGEGEIFDDPHMGSRARVLAATSAPRDDKSWRHVRRNLHEDYRRAFGMEPPAVVFVALLTDSDDSSCRAVADYGEIRLHPERAADAEDLILARPVATYSPRSSDGETAWLRTAVAATALVLAGAVLLLRRRRGCRGLQGQQAGPAAPEGGAVEGEQSKSPKCFRSGETEK